MILVEKPVFGYPMRMKNTLLAFIVLLAAGGNGSSLFAGSLVQARGTAQATGASTERQVQILGASYDGAQAPAGTAPVDAGGDGIAHGDGSAPRSDLNAEINTPRETKDTDAGGVPSPGKVVEKQPTPSTFFTPSLLKSGILNAGIPFALAGFVLGWLGGPVGALIGTGAGLVIGTAIGMFVGWIS